MYDALTPQALGNLKHYKYGAVDKSPLSKYVLQPYWSWAVQLFPLWMAPNLITLCGLGFVIANLACVAWLAPDLMPGAPSWLYFSCAVGLWLYSTFDNVDGKQARRTGTSSPLGELFDHGCDALNCSIGGVVQAAAMGLGPTWYGIVPTFVAITAFYMSTWEEYYTGVLYLGYINGPTEGLVMACGLMILSGIYGAHIWTSTFVFPFIGSQKVADVAAVAFLVMLILFQIPPSIWHVYKACKASKRSFSSALFNLSPIVVFLTASLSWVLSPDSVAMKESIIVFLLSCGIVFGRIATKIILAYVTRSSFPLYTVMMLPLVAGSIAVNSPRLFGVRVLTPKTEIYYLWGFFAFVIVAYVHWALVVIDKFCQHLKIKCLTIPYKVDEKNKTPSKKK